MSRQEVTVPPPGRHGGDSDRVAEALGVDVATILDLSASLNPMAPPAAAVVRRHADAVSRYPDTRRARDALAEVIGVPREWLLLTNGGAEAIALVVACIGGNVVEPEFALHPRGSDGPRWRSNPNNPTGVLAAPDDTAGVWDEAFYPLAAGAWTRGDASSGAVVVGSLTKVFACPGLRLGYVLAQPDEIERVAALQPQWSVSSLAAAAVPDLLASADLQGWTAGIGELRRALVTLLDRHDLAPDAAAAPWVICRRAPGLRERLAPHGVLVRDCTSFGMPGWARIAVPDERGLERLEQALTRSA